MSKSILVIDTPEKCLDCPLGNSEESDGEEVWCNILNCATYQKGIYEEDEELHNSKKPDCCPLKEVPQHKDYNGAVEESIKKHKFNAEDSQEYVYLAGKVSGWNMCINEILKEM